jgi:hypothetical protein
MIVLQPVFTLYNAMAQHKTGIGLIVLQPVFTIYNATSQHTSFDLSICVINSANNGLRF